MAVGLLTPYTVLLFTGYNFGKYLDHWLSLEKGGHKVPKIYHVNWFRKSQSGGFLWPGYGENIRVIDWIIRRLDGEEGIGQVREIFNPSILTSKLPNYPLLQKTAIGVIPTKGSVSLNGLGDINWDELMSLPAEYWHDDVKEVRKFLEEQVGTSH